jgi:hypothetical protein
MKKYLLLLTLVFPLSLLAQSNYQPGYVIKNNGDTLKGYINYRDWSRTPKVIEFKVNKDDGKATSFGAADIKLFSITGMETYISYIGLVSMDRNKFPDLPIGIDTTKAPDTVFLKQLVAGKNIVLYNNDDRIKTRFFIEELGGAPVELKYYQYYTPYKEAASVQVYKGQLTLYANKFAPGNEKVKSRIEGLNFDQSDLEIIARLLNGGSGGAKKSPATRMFVGVAADFCKTQVNGLLLLSARGSESTTAVVPKISVGYDLFDNPNVQHFALRIEADFWLISPELKVPVQINGTNTYKYYTFTQFTTGIAPQFLLNIYNKPNFKIFVAAGLSFNISIYPVNKTYIDYGDPATVQNFNRQNPVDLQTLWASAPLQAGLTINKNLQVFFVYDLTFASYARVGFDDSGSYSMNVGVRYLFGNK